MLLCVFVGTAWADVTIPYSAGKWESFWKSTAGQTLNESVKHTDCGSPIYYNSTDVVVSAAGDVKVTVDYTGGSHKIVILAVELLAGDGTVSYSDYHVGESGGSDKENVYTLSGVAPGEYFMRTYVCHKSGDHSLDNTSGNIICIGSITEKVIEPDPLTTSMYYTIKNVGRTGPNMLSADAGHAKSAPASKVADTEMLWALEDAGDGQYKFRNARWNNYLGHTTQGNTAWPMADKDGATPFYVKVQLKASSNRPDPYYVFGYEKDGDKTWAHDANWGEPYSWKQVVGWQADAEASQWIFTVTDIPVTTQFVEFTYSFTYKGVEKLTQTVMVVAGSEYPEITIDLPCGVTATKPKGTVSADVHGKSITIELEENLPFKISDDYANAFWYTMKIRGDKYVAMSNEAPYVNTKDIPSHDGYFWAFTGNPFDGFSILNKKAGAGYTLGFDTKANNSNVFMKDSSAVWNIEQVSGGFVLRQGTNEYMHDMGGKLQFWVSGDAKTDPGSALTFTGIVQEAELLKDIILNTIATFEKYADHIDYYGYDKAVVSAQKEVLQSLTSITTDADAFKVFPVAVALNASKSNNAPAVGDIIQFRNAHYDDKYLSAGDSTLAVSSDETDPSALWIVETGDNGTVKLKNYSTGKYLGEAHYSKAVSLVDASSARKYSIENPELFYVTFRDAEQTDFPGYAYVYCNGSGTAVWDTTKEGAKWFLSKKENLCSFTVKFMYGDRQLSSSSFLGETDVTYEVPNPYASNYLGIASCKVNGTAIEAVDGKYQFKSAANIVVTVELENALPFDLSADYNSAKWYTLKIRDDKYVVMSDKVPYTNTQNFPSHDGYFWAFTGNPIDGISILNKKAGAGYTLGFDTKANNSNVFMKDSSAVWNIEQVSGGFVLRQGTNEYMHDMGGKLQFWVSGDAKADAGSALTVEAESEIVSVWKEMNLAVTGYVGSYPLALENAIKEVSTFSAAMKFDETNSNSKIALETGKPYRIQNVYRKQMIGYNGKDRVKTDIGKTDISQLWEIKTVEGKVVVRNLNADAYMKAPSGGNTLVPEAEAAKFDLKPLGFAQYTLTIDANNLVIFGDGNLGGWSESPLGSDGAWYIIPATDIEVEIDSVGYATTYLPFDVTLPNSVKAYAVNAVEGDYAKLTEKADIPANTAAILEGEGTHTLAIADAASDWTGNLLKGTNVPANVEEKAYVLAMPEGENVGFYAAKLTNNKFLNNANKAYLPASAVPAAARFISFDFGTETAIENIEGAEAENAVVYDLSGRRVQKAQKGVFIVNGKVVIK